MERRNKKEEINLGEREGVINKASPDKKRSCGAIGRHKECGGDVFIHASSERYNVLRCAGGCGLRVFIPKGLNAFEEIKEYLDKKAEEKLKSFKYPPLGEAPR